MSGKLFKGDISNSVVELNLLEGDAGSLSYSIGGTNNGEIKVVHKGDITSSSGFANDSTLKGLVIGTSCTSIGSSSFYYCTGLTGSLVIPDSVTTIGDFTFSDCGFTGSLTIPDSVISIGYAAFQGCSGFNSSLTIPNSVTTIGTYAFQNCSSLTALYTNTPASSWIGTDALNNTTFTTIYTGPNATGYTSSFQGRTGLTISPWTNYPNIP